MASLPGNRQHRQIPNGSIEAADVDEALIEDLAPAVVGCRERPPSNSPPRSHSKPKSIRGKKR